MDLSTVLAVIIGAGGATFIGAVVRAWLDLRAGSQARERDVKTDLKSWNDELEHRAREAELDRDYWRRIANGYYGQLVRNGLDPIPSDPVAPSDRP